LNSPLDSIDDGYKFQQIIAEYFRSLKTDKHGYKISNIHVEDNGVGGDDGCDILVEFYFEDAISEHTQKWVVECKSQKKVVGASDINTNNIELILKAKNASGYLLVCKNDASSTLKRIFKAWNDKNHCKYVVWNGSQLWHKIIERKNILKAFFPEFYRHNFSNTNVETTYDELINEFKEKLKRELE
jgi:hypothetical protein